MTVCYCLNQLDESGLFCWCLGCDRPGDCAPTETAAGLSVGVRQDRGRKNNLLPVNGKHQSPCATIRNLVVAVQLNENAKESVCVIMIFRYERGHGPHALEQVVSLSLLGD